MTKNKVKKYQEKKRRAPGSRMGAGNGEGGTGYCHFFFTILVFKYDIYVTLMATKKEGRK